MHSMTQGAHPRSRGEHDLRDEARGWCRGSSPLARGTHTDASPLPPSAGLIPARAGNTAGASGELTVARAHPRSRGEHRLLRLCSVSEPGSSPLARGTLSFLCRFSLRAGLIPARAGNTGLHLARVQAQGAHPRSRGEHSMICPFVCLLWGSSPLARGTRFPGHLSPHPLGLIPARAGNTRTLQCR